MSNIRLLRTVAGATVALGLAASAAQAQGVSGTVLGAPDPGRFAASFDIGVTLIQMPRFRFGDTYPAAVNGTVSNGSIFDERNYRGGIAPAAAFGWGLPGGLFGQRAEIFGQFAFARATESGSSSGVATGILPFVNALPPGSVLTGLTGFPSGGTFVFTPSFERSFTSYDGQVGVRLHMRRGAWSFSPGVYVGFQRADLDESVGVIPLQVQGISANYSVNSSVASDTYQVGLALGTTYNLTPQVALFGIVQGGLDYARARMNAQSNFFAQQGVVAFSFTATASDHDTRVSGRVGLRSGVAWSPTPAVTLSLAGLLQYVGAVSNVVYPTHSTFSAIPTNGTVPARLGSEGQLNVGFAAGGTIRF